MIGKIPRRYKVRDYISSNLVVSRSHITELNMGCSTSGNPSSAETPKNRSKKSTASTGEDIHGSANLGASVSAQNQDQLKFSSTSMRKLNQYAVEKDYIFSSVIGSGESGRIWSAEHR